MKIKLPGQKNKHTGRKTRNTGKNIINEKSKFAIVEAYKAARTNLVFSLSASNKKAFAITSYSKGEGKSTAAANLAISFSKMGKKVVLIDSDLRRPNLHNILKIDNHAGFSDLLGKMVTFNDVVKRNVLPCLDVVTSGTIPPNPSELLCSSEVAEFVEYLYDEYDYIIFDTPPIGVVADSLLLKDYIAGYLLVVRERSTTHGDVEGLLNSIRLADAKILGFLKVGVSNEGKRSKNGYYYQYY